MIPGKLVEAEAMYRRPLIGFDKALGSEHTSTLSTINNLGILYTCQGRQVETDETYQPALKDM